MPVNGPSAMDYNSQLFRGQLQKAMLVAYDRPGGSELSLYKLEFFLNPREITVEKSVTLEEDQGQGNTRETRWTMTNPVTLKLGEIWFDTYESRTSVRKTYIDKLEKLLDYNKDTHHIPCVRFVWGRFTQDSVKDLQYLFYVEKLTAKYTMFLPDGTPVRASVQLDLKQALPIEMQLANDPKQSPDHAKLYTVKRGDTLQAIAHAEYDDPREWRRIADTNGIDDPMTLRPGSKLLVPPILK
ncbi:MAG: LysM peptidoglycan-binding domain-containing protein [Deltaproteobacteria bacterium]|nr:LysM peptidoglycan-binding domain-containing protein [Deltaproteobacteria bacterium]MCB9785931.1 LysM peptidoglycan-binding domain-containing protein [Deltaproteobacteria bacterium]